MDSNENDSQLQEGPGSEKYKYDNSMYRRDLGGGMVTRWIGGLAFTNGSRSSVVGLSDKSVLRMRRFLQNSCCEFINMTTLTYPGEWESDGKEVKKHLDKFMGRFMKHNESAFWFLEFQKRGAPHFHILHTDYVNKYTISLDWAWSNGCFKSIKTMTKVEKIIAGRRGMMSYISKYAAKQDQKEVPDGYRNVGRFWGVRGNRETWSADNRYSESQGHKELAEKIEEIFIQGECEGEAVVSGWEGGEGCYCRPRDPNVQWNDTRTAQRAELAVLRHSLGDGHVGEFRGRVKGAGSIAGWCNAG